MSREYPNQPVPAVGVVVWKGARVLMIKRAKEPRKGAWSLPGGAQHVGETVFDCAAREVLEETGCSIRVAGLVDVLDSVERDAEGAVRYHYTLIDVAARWTGGDVIAASDAADAAWFAVDELDALDLWSETRRIIDASRALLD